MELWDLVALELDKSREICLAMSSSVSKALKRRLHEPDGVESESPRHTGTHARTRTHAYTGAHAHKHARTCAYIRAFMCVCASVRARVRACVRAWLNVNDA